MSRYVAICAGVLLSLIAPIADAAGGSAAASQRSDEECRFEFHRSAASQSCTLTAMGYEPTRGLCSFGAECRRPEGGTQPNRETIRLTSLHLLQNCGGRIGFICN